jgi:hypothetical protein
VFDADLGTCVFSGCTAAELEAWEAGRGDRLPATMQAVEP